MTSEDSEDRGPCARSGSKGVGARLGPLPALLHQGPITGCPEGRLSRAHPPDSAGLPSVPAPCCLCCLTTPSLRPCLSSHASLPPWGPAGTHSATWGCWDSGRPPRSGGCTPDQAPGKPCWMGRLSSVVSFLPLPQALQSTSVSSQQREGSLPLDKGTPELEQSHWLCFHSDTGL